MSNFFQSLIVLFLLSPLAIAGEQTPLKRTSTISITIRTFMGADSSAVKNYAVALYDTTGTQIDSLVAVDTNLVRFFNVPLTGVRSSSKSPKEYFLGQNYPNPFNPSSRIKFSIPRAGIVSLKTYTILGQEDASLEMATEPGNYEVQYNPGGAAGVIFYRLKTKDFAETRKMVHFGGGKAGKSRLALVSSDIQSRIQQSRMTKEYQANTFFVKLYNLPLTYLPIRDTTIHIGGLTRDTVVTIYAGINPQVNGRDLVINEVFTLSPQDPSSYSWIELLNPTNHRIKMFDTIFPTSGYITGNSGTFLYSTDDGASWVPQTGAPPGTINDITSPFPDTGYICGDSGLFMKMRRDSNGVHFSPWNSPGAVDLSSIAIIRLGNIGYVCGKGGNLWRTSSSGAIWDKQTIGTTQNLNKVYMVDFQTSYVCGDSGQLWKTIRTNQWLNMNPAGFSLINFYSLAFTYDTGLVIGDKGCIMYTMNGAVSCTPETSGVNVALRGVYLADPFGARFHRGQGWVVGDSGVVLRTSDYGRTGWIRQPTPVSTTLRSVVFVDSMRGWASGDNGTILHTTNGGWEWIQQVSGTTERLQGTTFLPLLIQVVSSYVLEMRVQRDKLFYDSHLPIDFITNPNPNFITDVDTNFIRYWIHPYLFSSVPPSLPSQSFAILINDSAKFQDRVRLGPGYTSMIHCPYYIVYDTVLAFYKWKLLEAGELRLIKWFFKTTRFPPIISLGYNEMLLDLVRYGNYREVPDPAPQNEPGPIIPVGWSLARYGNLLDVNPTTESTLTDFYPSITPIPGWYSQRRK